MLNTFHYTKNTGKPVAKIHGFCVPASRPRFLPVHLAKQVAQQAFQASHSLTDVMVP